MRKKESEVTDTDEIERIIKSCDVCRIAFADGNIPYIVTMNFGYCPEPEKRLYFHSANEGRKLEMIRKNNFVCFEMDSDHEIISGKKGCDWSMKFSSVVGYGYLNAVSDEIERIEGLNCLMTHYSGCDKFAFEPKVIERTTVLRLDIQEMSCKKK
jgi:uncharacterized protein